MLVHPLRTARSLFEPTGVELRSDPAGKWPDPRNPIIAKPGGGFISASGSHRGAVVVWNPDGSYEKHFGRPGEGPGEFRGGNVNLFAGPDSQVYIRSAGRWTAYSSNGRFLREWNTRLSAIPRGTVVLDDGSILSSDAAAGERGFYFHHAPFGAAAVRSFGKIPPDPRIEAGLVMLRTRAIADAGSGRFWVLPVVGAGQGYRLELWDTAGRVHRVLKRNVAWFPEGSDLRDERSVGEGGGTEPPGAAAAPPPNALSDIYVDGKGRLFVYALVTTDRWRPMKPGEPPPTTREASFAGFDVYLEVIEPNRGVVLASGKAEHFILQHFAASRFAFERLDAATDPSGYRIFEIKLAPRAM